MTRALLLALITSLTFGGCSAGSGGSASGGGTDNDGGRADGGGNSDPGNGAETAYTSIAIEPALASLESVDGSRPEQVFSVIGTMADGSKGPVSSPAFSLASLAFGAISPVSGKFVATGVAGGETQVLVEVPGAKGTVLKAEATVRVRLERLVLGPGMTTDAVTQFGKPAVVDAAANLVYPLEGALMPQNVFPADVQWLTGNEGDVFELRFEKPNALVRAFVQHSGADFGNHYLVDTAAWRVLAQSDTDAPAVVRLKRWDKASGNIIESPTVSFSFARAALTGSVYYWDIAAGRIMRIDDGTNVAVSVMPTPAHGCVGCHSVSPSGRYMAGRLGGGDNYGSVFDLTTDLTGNPPPSRFSTSLTKWWFSSWSPDETRMVVARGNAAGPSLAFIDPEDGKDIPITGTLPSNATQPSWSPDGTEIAYVANGNNWGDHAVAGDIAILPVTGADAVGPSQIIHAGITL